MLEFIIKQDEKQIGQLQFDRNWTYDDAMRVLSRYVMRELLPNEDHSDFNASLPSKRERVRSEGSFSPIGRTRSLSVGKMKSYGGGTAIPLPNSELGLAVAGIEGVEILDMSAIGKKHVMKYNGKIVTGNILAGLVAISNLGGRISEARDLQDEVNSDARYESVSDSELGTLRYLLRALAELGFITEAEDGGRTITEVGDKIAKVFGKLSKTSFYAGTKQGLYLPAVSEPSEETEENAVLD